MDNRRVIRSYREKQAASSSATPYARPSSSANGLLSKVKQFFSPATTLWQRDEQRTSQQQQQQQEQQPVSKTPRLSSEAQEQAKSKSLLPFKFPEPEVNPELKTPLKAPSTSKNPNDVLSSFFQSKGDRELTDVEYEGVVALLSRSRQATPATVKRQLQPQPTTVSQTPSQKRTYSQVTASSQDDTNVGGVGSANSSHLFATPYTQKILKNNSTIFATPEYKPIYHTVQDNSFSQSRGLNSVPSVKRVYHFSGLPSPYRTRIITPSVLSSRKKAAAAAVAGSQSINTSVLNSTTTTFGNSTTTNLAPGGATETGKKPLSSAANALLSILDGGEGSESNESNIRAFSSPFSKPKRTLQLLQPQKKAATHSAPKASESTPIKKVGLTPADIAKTISFDQSKKLPELEESAPPAANGSVSKPTANGTSKPTAPTFSFQPTTTKEPPVSAPVSSSASFPNSVPASALIPVLAPSTSSALFTSKQSSQTTSSSSTITSGNATKSLFGSSTSQAPQPKANGSNGGSAPAFNFGAVTKPSTETNPVSASNTFTFPEITTKAVPLDQKKVESYKAMFNF